jgi:hypothetical protein
MSQSAKHKTQAADSAAKKSGNLLAEIVNDVVLKHAQKVAPAALTPATAKDFLKLVSQSHLTLKLAKVKSLHQVPKAQKAKRPGLNKYSRSPNKWSSLRRVSRRIKNKLTPKKLKRAQNFRAAADRLEKTRQNSSLALPNSIKTHLAAGLASANVALAPNNAAPGALVAPENSARANGELARLEAALAAVKNPEAAQETQAVSNHNPFAEQTAGSFSLLEFEGLIKRLFGEARDTEAQKLVEEVIKRLAEKGINVNEMLKGLAENDMDSFISLFTVTLGMRLDVLEKKNLIEPRTPREELYALAA